MRVLGHMVTRNEAGRFLDRSLASLTAVCSDVAVFDDGSDDTTIDIALAAGVHVESRDDDEVSFATHEGRFRDLAWRFMEGVLRPEIGDWILSLDADEVAIAAPHLITHLNATDAATLSVRIHELWELDPAMERVDGFWGQIAGGRLHRWRPGEHIADRELASGSVPPTGRFDIGTTDALAIAHLGYVRAEDRRAKHSRYRGRPGHNRSHVASILARPTLQRLPGGLP